MGASTILRAGEPSKISIMTNAEITNGTYCLQDSVETKMEEAELSNGIIISRVLLLLLLDAARWCFVVVEGGSIVVHDSATMIIAARRSSMF